MQPEVDPAASLLRWLVRVQALLVAVAMAMALLLSDLQFAIGVGLGGLGGILMCLISALVALTGRDGSPEGRMRAMMRAELLKFGIAILGFGALALLAPLHFLAALLGFAATLPAFWLALLRRN